MKKEKNYINIFKHGETELLFPIENAYNEILKNSSVNATKKWMLLKFSKQHFPLTMLYLF